MSKRTATTPLHLTTNNGTGSKTLCGVAKNATYGALADGTAHRYVEDFVWTPRYPLFGDPMLCTECEARLATSAGA